MTEPPGGWASPGSPDGPPPPAAPAGAPVYGAPVYGAPVDGSPASSAPQPGAPLYGAPQQQYGKAWAPQPGVVPLRPLALGELLDGAIKIVRRHPRPTLGLSAVIAAVVTVLNVGLVLLLQTGDGLLSPATTGEDGNAQAVAANVGSVPGALLSYLAGILLTGMLVAVVGKAVLGQEAPTSQVWQAVRPRLWALLGVALLTGLLLTAPIVVAALVLALLLAIAGPITLILGVPLVIAAVLLSIHLYARLSLASAALVLEKTGIRTSLRRSATLVKGSWWRVFGTLVLTGIITAVIAGILTVPPTLIAGLLSVTSDSGDATGLLVTQQVAAGLASVILAPFSAGVRALLYVDRRMRAEGLDVALQAAAATDTGTPPPAP